MFFGAIGRPLGGGAASLPGRHTRARGPAPPLFICLLRFAPLRFALLCALCLIVYIFLIVYFVSDNLYINIYTSFITYRHTNTLYFLLLIMNE